VAGENGASVTTIGEPYRHERLCNSHNRRIVQSQYLARSTASLHPRRKCATMSADKYAPLRRITLKRIRSRESNAGVTSPGWHAQCSQSPQSAVALEENGYD